MGRDSGTVNMSRTIPSVEKHSGDSKRSAEFFW